MQAPESSLGLEEGSKCSSSGTGGVLLEIGAAAVDVQEQEMVVCSSDADVDKCPVPLKIPSIVGSSLFPFLSVNDLKQCRLVCSMWAVEGTKALIDRSYYHLRSMEDVLSFLEIFRNSSSITGLEKLREFQLKISVKPDEIHDPEKFGSNGHMSVLDSQEFCELWKLIGERTTFLELGAKSWSCASLVKLLYNSVPHLKHLRLSYVPVNTLGSAIFKFEDMNVLRHFEPAGGAELEIEAFDFYSDECNNDDPAQRGRDRDTEPKICKRYVMTELIKRMPKLKKFACNEDQVGEDVFFLLVLENKDKELYNKELAEFKFPIQINEDEVKRVSMLLRYPLKKLDLVLRPGLRFPALYTFLSSLGATLTHLKVDFQFLCSQVEIFGSGKDLINLESLSLVHFNGSVGFIQDMRKLKTLKLSKVNLSVAFPNDMDLDPEKPHNLSSFEAHSCHSNAGRVIFPDTYRSMIKLFPQLKQFRIEHCSDNSLKLISDGFKELEELTMSKSICSDDGIIASLHKFQRLHKVVLDSPKLTDRSLEGIKKCRELRTLCLSSPRISGKSFLTMLQDGRLNLMKLDIYQCYGIPSGDLIEIQRLLPPGAEVSCSPCGFTNS